MKSLLLAAITLLCFATPSVSQTPTMPVNLSEVSCLAKNIYFEARGEPNAGKLAVAAVTLNRTASDGFPSSVCGVVYQRSSRGCQFSWTCDGIRDRIRETEVYADCVEIAEKIYTHKSLDNTDDSLYYHATYVNPRWFKKLEKTVRIGNHVFYRPRSA